MKPFFVNKKVKDIELHIETANLSKLYIIKHMNFSSTDL